MQIFLSPASKFCFGVERAIRIIEENLKKGELLYSIGPVIHNPQEIKRLENMGLKIVESIEKIRNAKLVISCYGISPHLIKQAVNKNISFVDATCPYVKNLEEKARKLFKEGYQVIIVGDSGHQEVETVLEMVERKAVIIGEKNEIKNLKLGNKVGIVVQTTQRFSNFKNIVLEILKRVKELKIYNTICSATFERQKETKRLAKKVDLMLIVGGKNSANTNRLFQISKEIVESYHIETADEIKKNWFKNKEKIGIISGASTPSWIIEEVVERVKKYGEISGCNNREN